MKSIESLKDISRPVDGTVHHCVQQIVFDYFGVFADAVLVAIHYDQAGAKAHCQRLRDQQSTADAHRRRLRDPQSTE